MPRKDHSKFYRRAATTTLIMSLGLIAILDLQGPYERWQYDRQKWQDGVLYQEVFGKRPPMNYAECRRDEADIREKINDLHRRILAAAAQHPGSKEVSDAWEKWAAAIDASQYCEEYIPGYRKKFASPPEKRAGFLSFNLIR